MLFWSLPRQRDVMPYRSPGCADVLGGARAHVTDFSYMILMDKSAVKLNMLKETRAVCIAPTVSTTLHKNPISFSCAGQTLPWPEQIKCLNRPLVTESASL